MTKPKIIELRGQDSFDIFRIDSKQDIVAWSLLIKGRSVFFEKRIVQLDSGSFSRCLGDLQEKTNAKRSRWTMYSWQTAECFSSLMGLEGEVEIPDDEEEDEEHQSGEDGVLGCIDHFHGKGMARNLSLLCDMESVLLTRQ